MLRITPVALLATVCKCRLKRSLAQGIVSGRHRPRHKDVLDLKRVRVSVLDTVTC